MISLAGFFISLLAAYIVREGVVQFFGHISLSHPAFRMWGGFIQELPLFFIAMLTALMIRSISIYTKKYNSTSVLALMDSPAVVKETNRITVVVLEVLILSAIAGMDLKAAGENFGIFSIFMIAGALWTAFIFIFFARRMLPDACWAELSIINYGMSTGITALGFLLLRSVSPSMNQRAILIYGLAAPFSAPFIGGGIISLLLPQLSMRGYGGYLALGMLVSMLFFYWLARFLKTRGSLASNT